MGVADELFMTLVEFISSAFMIFGGALPYIPQYLQMRKENSSEGFSLKVCLVLLTANILRIAFWFGKFYETPLLIQSIVMIFTMLFMLEVCIRLRKEHPLSSNLKKSFTDFEPSDFWNWSTYTDYLQSIISMIVIISLLTYAFVDSSAYIEGIGTLSLCTEATLALPQLFKNFSSGSTQGMSVKMVMLWFLGDSFKTLYFIMRAAPLQFLLCGSIQTLVDVFILYQVLSYGDEKPK
ncbi:solute carrier family 66 member 2-like [Bolinopsis microptera]|uniref:solute carrier family 66 member 2-like n=1 Tax=Bolinopsis microptera TaxID=2820187 RepID=UPI0030796E3A